MFIRPLYTSLMTLLTPIFVIRLWWKSRSLPAYKDHILERFFLDTSRHKLQNKSIDCWIHAVSLGEVITATPLIEALLAQQKTLLITTMTPTGRAQILKRFQDRVQWRYLPYDLSFIMKRFFKTAQPKLGIIIETELWPNMLYMAHQTSVPLYLVNARLSESSARGYSRIKRFISPLLTAFNKILVQSPEDGLRFKTIGATDTQIEIMGNLKYDLSLDQIDFNAYQTMKTQYWENRNIIILASTHEDEEAQILSQIHLLKKEITHLLVLIAPRHPERFNLVYQLASNLGFSTGLRSNPNTLSNQNEIVIIDTLGELLGFYHIADFAFVGGSLVPVGGHNVLEPIILGIPTFTGSHLHHFEAISKALQQAGGLVIAKTAREVIEQVLRLNQHPSQKKEQILQAMSIVDEHRGALSRCLHKIYP